MSATQTMSPFGTKATNNEGNEDFELPPAGSHPAVLIGLIDLGTHDNDYQGTITTNRKIFLVWELTAEFKANGEAFVIGQDYTWSLNKKAKFRGKVVEPLLGRTLADGEEYDPLLLLGKPCVVTISLGETRTTAKRFAEVSAITPPMKGLAVPPATRESFAYHISQAKDSKDVPEIPAWVPRNYGRVVTDDIRKSKEWAALTPF